MALGSTRQAIKSLILVTHNQDIKLKLANIYSELDLHHCKLKQLKSIYNRYFDIFSNSEDRYVKQVIQKVNPGTFQKKVGKQKQLSKIQRDIAKRVVKNHLNPRRVLNLLRREMEDEESVQDDYNANLNCLAFLYLREKIQEDSNIK